MYGRKADMKCAAQVALYNGRAALWAALYAWALSKIEGSPHGTASEVYS
jgi:hypothetical protein